MAKRLILILMLCLLAYGHIAIVFAQLLSIELLVRTKDGPGGRAKGDIVSMKASPASWGREEGPPNYVIVKVAGVSTKDFAPYHVRHGKLDESDLSATPERVRSRYRLNIDELPKAVEGKIATNIATTLTKTIDRRVETLSARTP